MTTKRWIAAMAVAVVLTAVATALIVDATSLSGKELCNDAVGGYTIDPTVGSQGEGCIVDYTNLPANPGIPAIVVDGVNPYTAEMPPREVHRPEHEGDAWRLCLSKDLRRIAIPCEEAISMAEAAIQARGNSVVFKKNTGRILDVSHAGLIDAKLDMRKLDDWGPSGEEELAWVVTFRNSRSWPTEEFQPDDCMIGYGDTFVVLRASDGEFVGNSGIPGGGDTPCPKRLPR